jgi:hypothetical protein
MNKPLSVVSLREVLRYESETGAFFRVDSAIRVELRHPRGYLQVNVLGQMYLAHRLAWLYVHGNWPTYQIDHINGVKTDNRIQNLRDVSPQENCQNVRGPRPGTHSGVLGVFPLRGKWRAQVHLNGRSYWAGSHETREAAHEAYLELKRKLHSGCTL